MDGPPPWPGAPQAFVGATSNQQPTSIAPASEWVGLHQQSPMGLNTSLQPALHGMDPGYGYPPLQPPPHQQYAPAGQYPHLYPSYHPPAPSAQPDSRFSEQLQHGDERSFSLQELPPHERGVPYPPIRTRSGDWNDGRPGSSASEGLGGGDEARGDVGQSRTDATPLVDLQQQAAMLANSRQATYALPSAHPYPPHLGFSAPPNLSRPLDAPQYFPAFHPLSAPQYQHHHPSFLSHGSPQPPPIHLGAMPSPSFQHSSYSGQQATTRPSSAGGYSASTNYSPPLPNAAAFQQHQQPHRHHSLPTFSYTANNAFPPLHTPTSLPSTPSVLVNSRPNTAGASAMSNLKLEPHSNLGGALDHTPSAPASHDIQGALRLASTNRSLYYSGSPVLAYNPAREPSAPTKAIVHRGGVKYAVGTSNLGGKGSAGGVVVGTSKAKLAELQASCYSCGTPAAKLILRGNDVEFGPRAEFTCLKCLPHDGEARGSSTVVDVEEQRYADTMSAAVDLLEGHQVRTARIITPEQTARELSPEYKRQGMICDVCDRVLGAGTIKSSYPTPPPTFTTEIICYPCLEKYKPCSDCGGGGGRLTPGRWRCKELFPAGRRTCQLSHARNPPLADIEYDVLSVRDVDQEKLEYLTRKCREVYVNTRLRTSARPEMLERADGLATTWNEAERMTIDQWHLLVPMLYEDIEPTRQIRRYVAYHSSTPHRRRAKPKVKVDPPPDEEAVEKELSGFMILEHDLEHGAVFVAVVMPWAISGDSFEATTILGEHAFHRIKSDLAATNRHRAEANLSTYPALRCSWCISPFRMGSRMTQSLTRRGYLYLEDYEKDYPGEVAAAAFERDIHVPAPYVKAHKIFVRHFEGEGDFGAAVAVKKPRVRAKKRKASE